MKRILIVGASSFIGSNLALAFRYRYSLYGTFGSHPIRINGVPTVPLPLHPSAPIEEYIRLIKPEAVIYCAGYSDTRTCEADPLGTLFVHAEAPGIIAAALAGWGGRFVYLSSSKIFSGEEGKYHESDPADPRTTYGQAKRHAEEILSGYENVFVLRLGTIFGLCPLNKGNIFVRILGHLWKQQNLALINDEKRSFLFVGEVARAIETILTWPSDHADTYHLSNNEPETYFDFGKKIATVFRQPSDCLRPIHGEHFSEITESHEDRGHDLTLDGSLFHERSQFRLRSQNECLDYLRGILARGEQ